MNINNVITTPLPTLGALLSRLNSVHGLEDVSDCVELLRNDGFAVTISHSRLPANVAEHMLEQGLIDVEKFAVRPHYLRAQYDLNVESGLYPVNYNYVSSRGGVTEVHVRCPGEEKELSAKALCGPNDAFNRRRGIMLALSRVFHAMCKQNGVTRSSVVNHLKEHKDVDAALSQGVVITPPGKSS